MRLRHCCPSLGIVLRFVPVGVISASPASADCTSAGARPMCAGDRARRWSERPVGRAGLPLLLLRPLVLRRRLGHGRHLGSRKARYRRSRAPRRRWYRSTSSSFAAISRTDSIKESPMFVRSVIGAGMIVARSSLLPPHRGRHPPTHAADLAGVMSGVNAGTSSYLFTHPDVNAFFTGLKGKTRDEMRTEIEAYAQANPQVKDATGCQAARRQLP